MIKKPFVTKEKVEEIVKTYPTPFHIYDEKGIRENAKAVKEKGLGGFAKIKKCVMAEENSVDIDTMLDWKIVEVISSK